MFFARLPADFFEETKQHGSSTQVSKSPGPSLLSGIYDDDDDDDEEEDQDLSNKSSVIHKTEISPPTQESIANSLPAGNADWNGDSLRRSYVLTDVWRILMNFSNYSLLSDYCVTLVVEKEDSLLCF